jgi:hypothetical protein
MLAAVSNAPVLAKEHLAPIMPAENFAAQEAWSALHQLFGGFRLAATETKQLCSQNRNQSRKLGRFNDELGLAQLKLFLLLVIVAPEGEKIFGV